MPNIYSGIWCIWRELASSLEGKERILLVTWRWSYDNIKNIIEWGLEWKEIVRVCEFDPNPQLSDLSHLLIQEVKWKFDAVITVWGGSVIDMWKLLYFFQGKDEAFIQAYLNGEHTDFEWANVGVPLISIPTTAGTGSESTHFAVLYDRNKTKHSVAHPQNLLPDEVFLDADMMRDINMSVLGPTILDSLCQCIESYWSTGATPESKEFAQKGLERLREELENISPETVFNPESKQRLLKAANYSGQAINISKTTASHAISYAITSQYWLPHGQAVALTLWAMFCYNWNNFKNSELNESRWVDYVWNNLKEILEIFGCKDAEEFREYINKLINNLWLEYDFTRLWITDTDKIADDFNEERWKNNPVKITPENLRAFLSNLVK